MSNIAIIFAAGHGVRMKSSTPKQFLLIKDKPILAYTLDSFEASSLIDKILVIIPKDKIEYTKKILKKYKYKKIMDFIEGSSTAFKSQFNGLKYLKKHGINDRDIVVIHDGVRPLIDKNTINNVITLTKNGGNAITVTPAKETISINDKNNRIQNIVARESSYIIRAPQAFYFKDIYNAHIRANKQKLSFIDSASLMQHYGYNLYTIIGPVENIKVTTEDDFVVCEHFLKRKLK